MEVEELFTPIWEKEYGWAERWMEIMDHPPEKIQARRRAYQARKKRLEGALPR